MTEDLAMVVTAVSVAAVLLAWLATSVHGRTVSAWLVGCAAALQSAQLAGVHAFTIFALAYSVLVVSKRAATLYRWRALTLPLAAVPLACTVLFGDLVHKPTIAVQLLALASSSALIALVSEGDDWYAMLKAFLAVTTVASVAAILQFVRILPNESFYGANRPNGLVYLEPDWLGMYAAIGSLLAALVVRHRKRSAAAILVNLAAVVLAGARGPWIGILLCLLFLVVAQIMAAYPSAYLKRLVGYLGGCVCGALGIVAASPQLLDTVAVRIASLANPAYGDAGTYARARQNSALLSLVDSSPWYGHGLSASGRVGAYGEIDFSSSATNAVGSNWLASWWIEGGILAIPLVALFLGLAAFRFSRGFGVLVTLILICNLFSNSSYLPAIWIFAALCFAMPDARDLVSDARQGGFQKFDFTDSTWTKKQDMRGSG
jgi:hypothetical protein